MKEARIYNEEKTASSISGAGNTGQAIGKRMELEGFLTPYRNKQSDGFNYKRSEENF